MIVRTKQQGTFSKPTLLLRKIPQKTESHSLDNFPEGPYSSLAVQEYAYIHDEENVPDTLKDVPFLESFTKEHLDDVLHSSAIVECDPGDVILEEGNEATRIFILLAGEIAVEKGGDTLVTMTTTGDIFGEMAALKDEVRTASVVAKQKTFCLAVDQRFLEYAKPREENPAFYASLYEFIAKLTAQRLKGTSKRLSEVDLELRKLKAEKA